MYILNIFIGLLVEWGWYLIMSIFNLKNQRRIWHNFRPAPKYKEYCIIMRI